MFNDNLLQRLGGAVHNVFALSTSNLTAPIVALTALTGQALGAFRLEGHAVDRRQVAELTVHAGSELRGRPLASAFSHRDALALAHLPAQGRRAFCWKWTRKLRWRWAIGWWCAASRASWRS